MAYYGQWNFTKNFWLAKRLCFHIAFDLNGRSSHVKLMRFDICLEINNLWWDCCNFLLYEERGSHFRCILLQNGCCSSATGRSFVTIIPHVPYYTTYHVLAVNHIRFQKGQEVHRPLIYLLLRSSFSHGNNILWDILYIYNWCWCWSCLYWLAVTQS